MYTRVDPACSDCSGISFVTDYASGDMICTSCGLVAEAGIFDDRPSRIPLQGEMCLFKTIADDAMDTMIAISSGTQTTGNFSALKRCQQQISTARNPVKTEELDVVCKTILHVSDRLHQRARSYYKEVTKSKPYKSEMAVSLQACSLYYVFVFEQVPRTIGEVCFAFSIPEASFTKAERVFRDAKQGTPEFRRMFDSIDLSDLIRRNVNKLSLSPADSKKVTKTAFAVLSAVKTKKLLTGRSSGSIISACIYRALTKHTKPPTITNFCKTLNLATATTLTSMLKLLPAGL